MTNQHDTVDKFGVIEAEVLEQIGYSPDMPYTSPHMIKQAVRLAIEATAVSPIPHQREEEAKARRIANVCIPYLDN